MSLTFQQIQKYEKGTNRVPASRLYELVKALSVPVQNFFDGLKSAFFANWGPENALRCAGDDRRN